MFKSIRNIHFVGIGGSGMSGIAEVLLKLGYNVTGSDLSSSTVSQRLQELGARVSLGHSAKNILGAHVVVTSTAVSEKNPEVKAAHKAGIPVIRRVEMLAEIARLKYTIAIAGTHGKTTTTSLVGQILESAGLDPTVIVGGRLKSVGTGGVLGKGDFLVAEADESDGSFLKLTPAISVITNIDNDHMDYYETEKRLLQAFAEFADRVPFYGVTFLCGDDRGVKKILPGLKRRFELYGLGKENHWRAENITADESGTHFDIFYKDNFLGRIDIPLSGNHNVLNALAATAVGLKTELSFAQVAAGLRKFAGVGRRIEIKGTASGVVVVDDYGHHPTEIRATISAIRARWPRRRLVVLFQPHRYTRTQLLYKEFAKALSPVDSLYLMPIYGAGEKPIKGVTSDLIAKLLPKNVSHRWEGEHTINHLMENLKTGDIFLTLGAGDVWKVGEQILKRYSPLYQELSHALPKMGPRIKSEESLARHCTWAIGGPAEVFAEAHTLAELKTIQSVCKKLDAPMLVLGWGSNVLLPDEGLRGCVVRLRGEFEQIDIKGTSVHVGGGVHLPRLAKKCAEHNLAGVEGLSGVPGTVGGALMTNAGTPRGVIGDVVESIEVLNENGSTATLHKGDFELGYRKSNLLGKLVIGAKLKLVESANGAVMEKIKQELANRENTQPLGTKNVGSVFKNPPNDFAARLIEEVGLKGHQEGRARFSPKHANFIENLGGSTATEVLALMKVAQDAVKEKFNVALEPEVKIIRGNARTQ